MKKHTPAAITLLVSLLGATMLMTQAEATDVDAVTATPALNVQQWGNVQYLNGGVGDTERAAMRSLQSEFPLQIVFSGKAGEYGVANQVRVIGPSGTVAAVDHAGPLVMFKLPPGRYTIEADFPGRTEKRAVSLNGDGSHLLHWATAAVSQN